jgi:RNA polymerase sigma-70 factor (ECF subfamily)
LYSLKRSDTPLRRLAAEVQRSWWINCANWDWERDRAAGEYGDAVSSIRVDSFDWQENAGKSRVAADARREIARLFEALRDPVFRQALRILRSPAEAEDVTQEVFLRLYGEMRAERNVQNPKAWLFRAVHNLSIDRARGSRHTQSWNESDDSESCEGLADPEPPAEERLAEVEKQEKVRSLLSGLSPQERRCMELRTEGLTYREIAEVLGVRITTVETNLARAVKKLMERIHA